MNLEKYIGFGVAGNFAHHLVQAGEAADFINVKVDDENAPKGIFPVYLPNDSSFLGTNPFSCDTIEYPKDIKDGNLQMEPEVALLCDIKYDGNNISNIIPTKFTAYNDCSIRKPNAKKISEKKNWGNNTKGISEQTIKIDKFNNDGIMDNYYITSYLKRDGKLYEYGENSAVLTYNYFYAKLKDWIIVKLNTQKNEGPLEDLNSYINNCKKPQKLLISIGATSYTSFGESTFLQKGDEIFVVIYDNTINTLEDIQNQLENDNCKISKASVLHQKII